MAGKTDYSSFVPSLSSSSSFSTWRKLQAASGLVFGVFQCIHFGVSHYSTIARIPPGEEQGRLGLERARILYQKVPLVELIFLGALVLHLISNAVLYFHRQRLLGNNKKKDTETPPPLPSTTPSPPGSLELKAHRYAGYIISICIGGHVLATRGAAWFFLDDPQQYDYSILAMVSDQVPFRLFVIYLIVFGMAGNWHLVYGVRSAVATLQGRSILHKPFPIYLKALVMVLHILIITSVLAICTDFLYPIDRQLKRDVYETIHKKMLGW